MAFTVTFRTQGPLPDPEAVAGWLTEQGEPFEQEGLFTFALRALPVRLVVEEPAMQAQLEVTTATPLVRMVDLLFALSIMAGADVRLAGVGEVTRSRLWLRLADEQDRLRISTALERADEHGNREDVLNRLWAVLSCMAPGRDIRWDAGRRAIVELLEVDATDGIPLEEAQWLAEDAQKGDVLAVPVEGTLHVVAWRWLSEAFPGLTE